MDVAALHDDSHTHTETRLNPGVYPSDPQGHTILVGTNERSLTVIDLGGVVQVGGIDVTSPDHLDALAARLHQAAGRLRQNTNR